MFLTVLVCILCLVFAFRSLKRKRLISDMPTSRTQGVFIGQTELKGTAESDTPLTSFLAGARCVYYSYSIEEEWRRTVTESYTDSKGHHHTRTRTESGWKTIDQSTRYISFYLRDDTGIIRILPEGAKVTAVSSFNTTCTPGDPLYYGKGPDSQIANSTHRRRFMEQILPLHAELYIFGQARERQDIAAAEVAKDKDEKMFLISTKPESKVSAGYTVSYWAWAIGGLIAAIGGGVWWNITADIAAKPAQAFGITIGGYIALLIIGWLWTVYNSLINLHHMVERGWSQVDVQLKRRFDLIPALETTVKGYATHEKDIQSIVTKLRAQGEAAPLDNKSTGFKGVSPELRIIAERYPDLKANESFLKFQNSLIDTEQRIALARDYFNNAATAYNTRLEIIPDRFIAALARLKQQALMNASDFERAAVKVELAE